MRKSVFCAFILTAFFASSLFAADLKIQYRDGDHGNAADNHIKPHMNIINQGSDEAAMSGLTIRYYYSKEGMAGEVFHVDYAFIGAGSITGTFHAGYLEIGFTAQAGNIPGYGQSGEIQLRFNKTDWSNYNETNDYSYNSSAASYIDWNKITLYQNGELVWGMEPGGSTESPQTPVPTPGPSTPEPSPTVSIGMSFVESGGMAVMEAEHFTARVPGTGPASNSSWEEIVCVADSSNGSAMKAVPNKGINVKDTKDGPRLDYDVLFETTGTYHLWVRMWGPSLNDDSLHAGMDGEPASFGKSGFTSTGYCWKWVDTAADRVTVEVGTTGLHTINIWMREDGTLFDKIVLTDDPGYIPQGQGSAESPVETSTPVPLTPTPAYESPQPGTPEPITPGPTPVAGAGSAWFEPAEIFPFQGDDFSVEIHVNSGDQRICAYQFRLSYNASVIQVDTVEEGPDGFVAAVNTESTGLLAFNGFDPTGRGPGVDLNFVTVYFTALSPGNSPLSLTIDSLVDNETNTVGVPSGIDGSVHVLESPTSVPTATPEGTELPVTEPTPSATPGPPTASPEAVTPTPTPVADLVGDVNGDGMIDIIDALLCAQYYVGLSPSGFYTDNADVNADGVINIIDALLLAQYYVGLLPGLPVASPVPGDPTPVPEEGAGSMWIEPQAQTVATNSEFSTEIHLNTGLQSLGAYGIVIHYNSQYLTMNTAHGMSGADPGPDGPGITSVNSSISGQLAISALDPFGVGPDTDLHILTIYWISGNVEGTSSLEISIIDLVDPETAVIGIPNGTGGSVTVIGTAEPSPVPGTGSQPGDVWFLPVRQVVTAGDDVQAEIRLNSGDQRIAAYGLDIIYDPGILGFYDLEEGADGFIVAYSTTTAGLIRVSGFDTSGMGPGPDLHLMTVYWHTSGPGTAVLNLNPTSLADPNTNTIGAPNGIPGEVIVMPVTPGVSLKAQYLCGVAGNLTDMIRPYFNIVNIGTESVSLSEVALRYYYSKDGALEEVFYMDYAEIGTSLVTGTLYPDYLEIGFTEDAGTLEPLEETGQIICGIGRTDEYPYEQVSDYSYEPSYTDYADYRKVALFIGDTLVWGSVPLFPPAPNPTPVITPEPTTQPTSPPTYTPTPTPPPTAEPVPGAGNVWFVPDIISVDEGSHFETEIHVNSGNQKIGAYGFRIAFDESVVQVDIDQGAEGVSAGPDGFVTVVNPDDPGELIFAGYDTAGKAVGTDINFVKVYWIAVGPGTSLLDITVETLVDVSGYGTIGAPNGIDGEATVIATTPTPDPTPTPEPTEYPGPVEGAGNVWFSPSSQAVNTGDNFTTEIHVNSGYQEIASFGFVITFDPAVLKVNTAVGNKGVEAGPDGFVLVVNAATPGTLRMSGIDNGSGPGTDLHFQTIHWIAAGEGTTQLDLTIEDLGDNNYTQIGTPNAIDGTVQVTGSSETPGPTPESPGPGSVWIEPVVQMINAGDGCEIEIHLNTGNQVLGAYQLRIGFDESVAGIRTETGTDGVDAGADGFVTSVNASTPGTLIFNGFDTMGKGPGSDLHLATVYFTGIAAGTSQLTIMVETLVDLMYETIGTPDGIGGSIMVAGTSVTPEPTPEPTIEPTAEPTPEPTSLVTDAGTVWIVPGNQTVSSDDYFTTEIHVNTGNQVLAAYGIDILYDETIIIVNTGIGSDGVEEGSVGYITAVNSNIPGQLKTSGFDISGTEPGSDLHIITVNWTAIGVGTTALGIDVQTLANLNGDTIGIPVGIDGTVTVQ